MRLLFNFSLTITLVSVVAKGVLLKLNLPPSLRALKSLDFIMKA